MKSSYLLLAIFFLALTGCYETACDEEPQNEVLRTQPKSSVEYQRELAKLAQEHRADTEFKFEEYLDKDTASFIVLNTFGPDFCGELHLLIRDTEGGSAKAQDQIGFKNEEVQALEFSIPPTGYPVLETFGEIDD